MDERPVIDDFVGNQAVHYKRLEQALGTVSRCVERFMGIPQYNNLLMLYAGVHLLSARMIASTLGRQPDEHDLRIAEQAREVLVREIKGSGLTSVSKKYLLNEVNAVCPSQQG
jgi:hypothetical protein